MPKTLTSAFNIVIGKKFIWKDETYTVKFYDTPQSNDALIVTDSAGHDHNFNPYCMVEEVTDA